LQQNIFDIRGLVFQ